MKVSVQRLTVAAGFSLFAASCSSSEAGTNAEERPLEAGLPENTPSPMVNADAGLINDAGLMNHDAAMPAPMKPTMSDAQSETPAPAETDSAAPTKPAPPWPNSDRVELECMIHLARAAREREGEDSEVVCDALFDEPFEHQPDYDSDVMRVFARRYENREGSWADWAVAFAGTRVSDVGDVLRDLQSQIQVNYTNHFGEDHPDVEALPGSERVGSGFDARWRNQAPAIVKMLEQARAEKVAQGQAGISVLLVGHSLGGVTALRSSFDIARSTRAERVKAWALNPPRVGNVAFAEAFVNELSSCALANEGCFTLHQLTRTGDAVHGLPLAAHHPVWNPDQEDMERQKTGAPVNQTLDYCSHYHAPRASILNPYENHELLRWLTEIPEIPQMHIDCMFQ